MTLLNSGKDTYKAIALLKYSIGDDPNVAAYHEALAFAYTDKAAFIFRALYFRHIMNDSRNGYLQALFSWEWGRLDKHSATYSDPRPLNQPFHVFHLKDDGSVFSKSDQQAVKEINTFCTLAGAQWADALGLAKTDSDQGRIHYEHASADSVFAVIKNNYTLHSEFGSTAAGLQMYRESADEIAAANRLQPQNGLYWEAAGGIADYLASQDSFSPATASHPFYIKSLALQPDNAPVWLKLAGDDRRNTKAVQYDLSQAYRFDPKNELVLLSYINALYKTTHYNTGGFNDPSIGDRWKTLLVSLDSSDSITVKTVDHLLVDDPTPTVYDSAKYDYPYPAALISGAKESNTVPDIGVGGSALRNAARCIASTAKCLAMQGKPEEGIALLNGLAKSAEPMLTQYHFKPDSEVTGKLMEALFGGAIMGIAMTNEDQIADDYEPKTKAVIIDKAFSEYRAAAAARRREQLALISKPGRYDNYMYY
jgi:hypothetical protein